MNVKWLFEKDTFEEDLDDIQKAVTDQGMEYKLCTYVPFEGDSQFLNLFDEKDCVIFYGSLQYARQIKRVAKWVPGVYCTLANYECLNYYPYFGDHLLNADYLMLPFGELDRRRGFLYDTLGEDGSIFLRPSSGFKTFTGTIVNIETWSTHLDKLGCYGPQKNDLIIAARPRNLGREWRCLVADGMVITASQYRNGYDTTRISGAPFHILKYAQDVVNESKYNPDPVWALDICETKSGEPKVLEVGGFSCAGLYKCDPNLVVSAVSQTALKEWKSFFEE